VEEPPAPAPPPRKERAVLLTMPEVAELLGRARPQVRACFARNRPLLPAGAGKLEVELAIANSGAVRTARVMTAGLDAGPLAGCISWTLRSLRFPKNINSPPLTIIVPYSYSAAGQ
jgi:hypothetical protein